MVGPDGEHPAVYPKARLRRPLAKIQNCRGHWGTPPVIILSFIKINASNLNHYCAHTQLNKSINLTEIKHLSIRLRSGIPLEIMFKTNNWFQSNGDEKKGFISLAIRQKAESKNRFYKTCQIFQKPTSWYAKIVNSTDEWSLTYFKSILKISHSIYL